MGWNRRKPNFRAVPRPGSLLKPGSLKLLPLGLLLSTGLAWGQDFPGGELQTRQALISERGSHPTVIVQTVPQATTTATALVLRYAQPGKEGDPSSAAHLLEHLLFRTRPNDQAGALLLRNEALGNSSKAWVNGSTIVFSEEVPAEKGLDSLQLQLDRLKGVPRDPEGWKLEKEAIAAEIERSRSPEDEARRQILAGLGYQARPAGTLDQLRATRGEDLAALLQHLDLSQDVIIAVVGPQTAREVRQQLSTTLAPLAPQRTEPRKESPPPTLEKKKWEVTSTAGYDQRSTFFESEQLDPRVVALANTLTSAVLPYPVKARLTLETGSLFRLDVSPADADLSLLFDDLTPALSQAVYQRHEAEWLERLESRQERAESLALATLRHTPPESWVTPQTYPQLLQQAKALLKAGTQAPISLTLKPAGSKTLSGKLFDFATVAHRENLPAAQSEKLPNQLTVMLQPWQAWPTVALAGFFRVSPALSYSERTRLERFLKARQGGVLKFDVSQSAVFFQAERPSDKVEELLRDSALELRALSQEKSVLASPGEDRPDLVESFFLPPSVQEPARDIAGNRIFAPQNAHLVVVGQYDSPALERGLRPSWSGWFGKNLPPGGFKNPGSAQPSATAESGKTVDIPKGREPILLVGLNGPARSSPDFMPFNLAMQTIAGRPYSSLISREFQSGEEAVDSVRLIPLESSVNEGSQVWVIALRLAGNLRDPAPVVNKLNSVFKTLGGSPLASSELERTREYLKSSLALSASSNLGRARVLAHSEYYRLSRNYTTDFAGLYDNLTPETVQQTCAKILGSQSLRWLYLRPEE